jgi:hypothetical protein
VRLDTLSANVKNETHAPETPASATVQLLPGTNIPKRLIKLEATPLSLRVVLDASIPVMYDHVKSDGCDSPILSSGHPLTLLGQPSDVIVKVVFITSGPAKITSLWRDSLKLR